MNAAQATVLAQAADLGAWWNTTVTLGWAILWTVVGLAGFAAVIWVGLKTRSLGAIVGTLAVILLIVAAGLILRDPQGTADKTDFSKFSNNNGGTGSGTGDGKAPGAGD